VKRGRKEPPPQTIIYTSIMNCWAAPLGDCVSKMSREHVFSASLFSGKTVMVQGFEWCKDKPKEIGISGLTRKTLCREHNSGLSPLDAEAGCAFGTLRAMAELYDTRIKLKPRIWTVKKFSINGALLERWFLKSLINVGCGRKYPIGRDAPTAGKPSQRLVRIAFGLEDFDGQAGLYTMAAEGMRFTMEDRVQCLTLISRQDYVEGAVFGFRGIGFLLCLEKGGPGQSLLGLSFGGVDLGNAKLLQRGSKFRTRIGRYESHALWIKW
jgi:hypothetical protein